MWWKDSDEQRHANSDAHIRVPTNWEVRKISFEDGDDSEHVVFKILNFEVNDQNDDRDVDELHDGNFAEHPDSFWILSVMLFQSGQHLKHSARDYVDDDYHQGRAYHNRLLQGVSLEPLNTVVFVKAFFCSHIKEFEVDIIELSKISFQLVKAVAMHMALGRCNWLSRVCRVFLYNLYHVVVVSLLRRGRFNFAQDVFSVVLFVQFYTVFLHVHDANHAKAH